MSNIYEIPVPTKTGITTLLEHKNSVLLIVNIASKCGLAKQNLSTLSDLLIHLTGKNFKILLFPSNTFLRQEPKNYDEISDFINDYSSDFILYNKVDVMGSNKHALYNFLCDSYSNGWLGSFIKWNFTKFLVDKHGKVVMRYGPNEYPSTNDRMFMKVVEDASKVSKKKEKKAAEDELKDKHPEAYDTIKTAGNNEDDTSTESQDSIVLAQKDIQRKEVAKTESKSKSHTAKTDESVNKNSKVDNKKKLAEKETKNSLDDLNEEIGNLKIDENKKKNDKKGR